MTPDVIATVLTGAGVLLGVWKIVDGARRELNTRIDAGNRELRADILAVNTRIDNILLADRKT
jgi:hypothetical protein